MNTDGHGFSTRATLLSALLAAALPCLGDIPSGWSTNLTATLKSAETHTQPVLLYFTATWCGPCKLMQANTLPDSTVRSNLAGFAAVALDLDASPVTAQKYSVSAIPAFLILTAAGDEILRTEGYREAAAFNAWLDKAKAVFAEAQEKVAAFVRAQADIEARLKSDDAAARRTAFAELFNLCADREPSHQSYAASQLKALAARDPKALLVGLEHPKLATRITVANQLRDVFGNNFAFDPWASAVERSNAVAALRNQSWPATNSPVKQAERPE